MPGKYIKKHVDVYDLMSSDDDTEMKVYFNLQTFHVFFFLKR